MTDLENVKAFERDLDLAFDQLASRRFDASQCLDLAANIYESAASGAGPDGLSEYIERGIQVLAPHFVSGKTGIAPDAEHLIADLIFGSHYYMLREYLYYTYNAPGSFIWRFSDKAVEIKFADKSIPRQFFIAHNNTLINSRDLFSDYDASPKIIELLTGQPEGELTRNVQEASALIEHEADMKLGAYFSILSPSDSVDLGGYTYADFISVYRVMLTKALYHRYFFRANHTIGAIFISRDELVGVLALDVGRDEVVCSKILNDIVYDARAAKEGLEPLYFPLYQSAHPKGARIAMCPHHFAAWEGIVGLFRVVGARRPKVFLDQVSKALGRKFVGRLRRAFEQQGFACRSNIDLRRFDDKLPDIDLAVVSEEPTLGYVVYLCEIKGPIPPRWAKDQLRALNKDNVAKAFSQIGAIRKFMNTEEGLTVLRGLLPREGHPHFKEFVITIHYLVITSDNAGMFFGDMDQTIIDFRTLERLLTRSDGDIAFIQHVLATYSDEIDKAVVTTQIECQIGNRIVRYEGVTRSPVVDFPQLQWQNSPERQQMIDEFITGKNHPFDALGPFLNPMSDKDDGD